MQNPPDKDSDLYEIYMAEQTAEQKAAQSHQSTAVQQAQSLAPESAWGPLDSLPGNPMMWILIISELMVFGLLLAGYSITFINEPDLFRESQAQLSRLIGGLNTLILITSGLFAALANEASKENRHTLMQRYLLVTACFGILFLLLKFYEYTDKAALGISIETNSFYTLFYLMTGFHAAHVIFGLAILGLVSRYSSRENIQTACAFWHMVDLIWLILYPVLYLVR
ncbi:cytochrome c oxidase subunit 3 family protein [Kiloniella laminariae]|uniref:Cytochrome c oxidase subunit 3 family protein n=1 Tax=Kiloniella laminariae TaxID=454162 RepID=A0ABT4LPD8_9PROT|nr:cytochrome c oxidase subunit 3 family protein [Kiloniella laminariae]MCZ4282944.1 cytochrome c oxidase subunit 3 family protein [Kiloniella laminariae]